MRKDNRKAGTIDLREAIKPIWQQYLVQILGVVIGLILVVLVSQRFGGTGASKMLIGIGILMVFYGSNVDYGEQNDVTETFLLFKSQYVQEFRC